MYELEQDRLAHAHPLPTRNAYSFSVKVPQRRQRNERSHWEYRRL